MKLIQIENTKTPALTKQVYNTDLGYTVKVVTVGIDTHITATPQPEVLWIAPIVSFISKESRSLEIKNTVVSMEDVPIFAEWVNRASKLLEYIYEHYDELVPQNENEIEK